MDIDVNSFIYGFLLYITVPSVILCSLMITYKVTGNRKEKRKDPDKTVPTTLGCIVFLIASINFIFFALILSAFISSLFY